MGGGHVSRPDFGMPQPDAAYPLTEFYLLAQQALEKSGSFMLPALYAGLQAPARRIYREEAAGYLQLAAAPAEGLTRLLSPARMQLLYSSLQVQPDGTPAALWLTEECTRLTVAVQPRQVQPSLMLSAVRRPLSSTLFTAFSMASASSVMPKE